MLKNYDLRLATELHVLNGGVNKVGEIAKEHGAKKIMLVADPGIRKTGIPAKVAEKTIQTLEKNTKKLYYNYVCSKAARLSVRGGQAAPV